MLGRGNATSGAPICNGTMMLPNAVKSGVAKRNSMIVPCMVNSWLYWTFDCSIMPGAKSSNRMTMAMIPARMKKKNEVYRYMYTITLWSVEVIHETIVWPRDCRV